MKLIAALDLEILGTEALDVAVIQIAIVVGDAHTGEILQEFDSGFISIEDNVKAGRVLELDTIFNFWMKQPEEARALFSRPSVPLIKAIQDCRSFIESQKDLELIFGNGVMFDNAILKNLFKTTVGLPTNWTYKLDSDLRTIRQLQPQIDRLPEPEGFVKHDALWDARYQFTKAAAGIRFVGE